MALVRNNPIVSGLSGMLGGVVVFRTLRGKTVMANRPRKPSKESAAQRTNRDKFADAACFAQAMMKDPAKKDYYWRKAKKLGLPNGYTAAIKAYMRGEISDACAKASASAHGQGVRKDRSRGQVRRMGYGEVQGAKVGGVRREVQKGSETNEGIGIMRRIRVRIFRTAQKLGLVPL